MKKGILLYLFLMSIGITAHASHTMGMHISYEYIGVGNTYLFKVKSYSECSGVSPSSTIVINFSSVSCGISFSSTLSLGNITMVATNSCAGNGLNTCQGGTIFGFEEVEYTGLVTLVPCNDWVVNSSVCCRNAQVTNILDPDIYSTYVETRFNNLNFPNNSSPILNALPVNYYCVGNASIRDYSAIDIDGDSLTYELVEILDEQALPLQYIPGYSYNQPVASLIPSVLDSVGGVMTFTPSAIQFASVGILVSEYRNGDFIGSIRVDDQIVVTSGFPNPDTVSGRVYFDTNLNSIYDNGDQPAPNLHVSLLQTNYFGLTDANGKFDFYCTDGIYDLEISNLPPYSTSTPASIAINTNGTTFSGNNDFILSLSPNVNDLKINLNECGNPVPGESYYLVVDYENVGSTVHISAYVTLTLDANLHFVTSNPLPSLVNGNTLIWNLPQVPLFYSDIIHIEAVVDTTATIGAPVNCFAHISSPVYDVTPSDNNAFLLDYVAASCDPNYKEVFPPGDLNLSFINAQDWLTYKINFQNLGNAPAQDIRISDYLDMDMEFSSLEFIASSFPCSMNLTGINHLEFGFSGINLPSASVNEPASHGFVEYRIRPKSSVLPGSYLTNHAGIFFDYNLPVYTNVVYNKVVSPVGISENSIKENLFDVYPNPASDCMILNMRSEEERLSQFEIFNLTGSLIKKMDQQLIPGENQIRFSTKELANGTYFILVPGEGKVAKFNILRQ